MVIHCKSDIVERENPFVRHVVRSRNTDRIKDVSGEKGRSSEQKNGRYKGTRASIDFPKKKRKLKDLFKRKTAGRCMQTSPPCPLEPIG